MNVILKNKIYHIRADELLQIEYKDRFNYRPLENRVYIKTKKRTYCIYERIGFEVSNSSLYQLCLAIHEKYSKRFDVKLFVVSQALAQQKAAKAKNRRNL